MNRDEVFERIRLLAGDLRGGEFNSISIVLACIALTVKMRRDEEFAVSLFEIVRQWRIEFQKYVAKNN
jgi:hypothetical protein